MQNVTDFRTDHEVLIDHLGDLARDIQAATDPGEIRALAAAQLLFIERFKTAEAKANTEAAEALWARYQRLGHTDRQEFDELFPPETNGRLAPPVRRVFNPTAREVVEVVGGVA